MAEDIRLQYGMSDIYVNDSKVSILQGEAAEFSATPQFEDIDLYEVPSYDKVLTGWDVKLKLVLEDYQYENLKLALPMLFAQGTETDTFGLSDGALGQRARDKAIELRLHPREFVSTDKKFDLTVHKAFPVSSFEAKLGKELSKWEVEFVGLAKTADPTKANNYFLIGDAAPGL